MSEENSPSESALPPPNGKIPDSVSKDDSQKKRPQNKRIYFLIATLFVAMVWGSIVTYRYRIAPLLEDPTIAYSLQMLREIFFPEAEEKPADENYSSGIFSKLMDRGGRAVNNWIAGVTESSVIKNLREINDASSYALFASCVNRHKNSEDVVQSCQNFLNDKKIREVKKRLQSCPTQPEVLGVISRGEDWSSVDDESDRAASIEECSERIKDAISKACDLAVCQPFDACRVEKNSYEASEKKPVLIRDIKSGLELASGYEIAQSYVDKNEQAVCSLKFLHTLHTTELENKDLPSAWVTFCGYTCRCQCQIKN